jgi:hypothetical protein
MTYSNLLKRIWDEIYDPHRDVIQKVQQYFHKDFKQCINGVSMNREEYTQHILQQKSSMEIKTIEYKKIIEKNHELFALYTPKGKNNEGHAIEAEVIAYFHFEKLQLIRIHGQVQLLQGSLSDVDMHPHE